MKFHHLTMALTFASLSLAATASAAPELKPFQEEAKAKFDESMEEPLKAANKACGITLTVASEYEKFDAETWKGRWHYGWCVPVLEEIEKMCASRPAYKKALAKKLKSVRCLFSGVEARDKKDSSTVWTRKNMSVKDGTFIFHMDKEQANLNVAAKEALEAALN
ncbi:MAG: hypothetical protein IPK13_01620 [Deltaproteobacteria bacterium]|nr:hypothetical protein [Deltaproteobacteria bacterium]